MLRVGDPDLIFNPTPADGDLFGQTLLILDGVLLVGAPGDDTAAPDAGAVYVFDVHTGELLRTLTDPGAVGGERIGFALAPAGTEVLVGAPFDDRSAFDGGAAYLFDPGTGTMIRRFENPTPQHGDNFGGSLAMAGANLVVGAPWDQTLGEGTGAAYVFDAATGDLVLTLLTPFARQGTFGSSMVALPGDHVAIGEPLATIGGAVHQYDLAPGSPTFGARIRSYGHAPQSLLGVEFGRSLAEHDGLLFVGDVLGLGDWPCAADCLDALHVFDTATGAVIRLLKQPISPRLAGPAFDYFTWALATSGDDLFVSSPGYDVPPGYPAYQFLGGVFRVSGSTGLPVEFFVNPSERQYDWFGASVAATAETVFVGAPQDDTAAPVSGIVFKLALATQRRTKCFKARDVTQPRFSAQEITMTDRFGTWQATVKKPERVCAPVEIETMHPRVGGRSVLRYRRQLAARRPSTNTRR